MELSIKNLHDLLLIPLQIWSLTLRPTWFEPNLPIDFHLARAVSQQANNKSAARFTKGKFYPYV